MIGSVFITSGMFIFHTFVVIGSYYGTARICMIKKTLRNQIIHLYGSHECLC